MVVLGLGVQEWCWQVEVLHILVWAYYLLFANGGAALLGNLEGFHCLFVNCGARFGCTGMVLAVASLAYFGLGIPSATSWKLGRFPLAICEQWC